MEDLIPAAILQAQAMALPQDMILRDRDNRSYGSRAALRRVGATARIDGTVLVFKDVTCRRFEEEQAKQDEKQNALVRMAEGVTRHLDLEIGAMVDESARLLDGLAFDSALRDSAETLERAALDAFAVTCRLQTFARTPEIKADHGESQRSAGTAGSGLEASAANLYFACRPEPGTSAGRRVAVDAGAGEHPAAREHVHATRDESEARGIAAGDRGDVRLGSRSAWPIRPRPRTRSRSAMSLSHRGPLKRRVWRWLTGGSGKWAGS